MERQDSKVRELEWLTDSAAKLTLVEVGFGALLHGLHIPGSGSFLSLVQGYFLCLASRASVVASSTRLAPIYISSIGSLLKTLAPAGKKLGPMLAISVQGILFNLGTLLFGRNRVGETVGMLLLAPWSFAQQLFMLYLFFGYELIEAALFVVHKIDITFGIPERYFLNFGLAFIATKVLLAALVPFLVSGKINALSENFLRKIPSIPKRDNLSVSRGIARDMTRPLFLFSLTLLILYLVFTESDHAVLLVKVLRPIATAAVIFWISRSPIVTRLSSQLRKSGKFSRFFYLADLTLEKIRARSR